MTTYLVLIRGINVGGKNKITMSSLKECLEQSGFNNVSTYIASGNVILKSDKKATEISMIIEQALPENFQLDSELLKVLVVPANDFKKVIEDKPSGFGEQPAIYHSDVIFLIDISVDDAMTIFKPREEVDRIWPGKHAIYSQRLSAERTKSRLNKIMESPLYKSMTIRSWNTTAKLFELLSHQK